VIRERYRINRLDTNTEIEIRFSLSFPKGEGVPNRYAIKVKEVSPEILSTSTKPYYIPFYYNT